MFGKRAIGMKDIFYLGVYYVFKGFILLIPNAWMYYMAKGISRLIYLVDKKHKHIAKVNLKLAYGQSLSEEKKEVIVKASYVNLMLLLIDFIRNQGISKEKLLKKVTFKNAHILTEALEAKKNIILITAHYGNWELVPLAIAANFGPLTGVGRKIDTASIDTILKQNREQFDIEMLEKTGAMKPMINALKNGRMLGLLVDQNTTEKDGLLVDFFGKPVRHTPAAAILARRFDAVIIPAFIRRTDSQKYTITFYEPILTEKTNNKDEDIRASVQKQAKITEDVIREKPEEWFWLHKRWKNQFEECYN